MLARLVLFIALLVPAQAMAFSCGDYAAPVFHDGLGIVVLNYGMYAQDDFERLIGFERVAPLEATGEVHEVYAVSVTNQSGEVLHANPHHIRAITKSGRSIPPSIWTFRAATPFPAVNMDRGSSADGLIVFPAGDRLDLIVYDDGERRVERGAFDGVWLANCMSEQDKAEQQAPKATKEGK